MLQDDNLAIPITAATAADCLLVVDEDEANINGLHAMLGNLGFEILPAKGGAHALRQLADRSPDLILLNVFMREIGGIELCKRIQENPAWADIPIVFFSSTFDKDSLVRALESGGADYLAHPFDKAELLSRIRTHLMLKTTRDHLKQLALEKEELLSMISHYLQNHLVGMNMSAQLLLDRTHTNGDAKLRLMAENIWASSNQMRVFIKSLLANSAADRGFKIHFEAIDFSAAVAQVVRQYEETARCKQISIEVNPLPQSVMVKVDSAGLHQVLDNLISNAIKFSPSGKKITVSLRAAGKDVECHIQDEGPGFTDADMARMFHRYARLSARPTAGEPSTGLGLSIAKKLMHGMKGELTCRNSPGHGATFILRFPISQPDF